ncbi:MAG: DNA polymerase III subunit beta [Vicinamibacterales bacterium]|jgi:DNA polymerase-3 subunit beta|nr:DNA polymerase III subunit beta [Vicinamibacterales bacterium]HJO16868.1 DNA polymerase III subunit beta [Vicinamibacterales bacterium]|tara:strand:- start:1463 stop:2587 length:1125 start_codon:yes stop_codon:yes gene_type:complete
MDLVVRKKEFFHELQLFQGIVERKNTIPVLANVLLEAEGDKARMVATDLEVALDVRFSAKVKKGGTLTLPAKKLFEIVQALPDTNITIREEGQGAVNVSADNFESRIRTLPRQDFPTLPKADNKETLKLPGQTLRNLITRTKFAITSEDTRYFLNGALFYFTADELTLVATDGHRLALITGKQKSGGKTKKGKGEAPRVILPKKTLTELAKLLTDDVKEIGYQQSENHLFFEVGDRVLISRMIDGQFPAYERVIPKGNDKVVEFDNDRLAAAIKRVAVLSNDRSQAVKIQINKNKVEITSNTPDVGEASEELDVQYTGDSVQICLNAKYILDFLREVETDSIRFEFKDETTQAVMQPVGLEGYNYTYVIMPMRI